MFSAGFLLITIALDGYGLVRVVQHWRTYGDVYLHSGITTILITLTVAAILSLIVLVFDRPPPR